MNKLLLLLAGSNLSEREISKSLREVFMMSDSELYAVITELRNREPSVLKQRKHAFDIAEELHQSNVDNLVIEQVSQMLREDTGLTALRASEMLVAALQNHLSESELRLLPALNKESFNSWVRKVAAIVPQSILLHEAAKIRNAYAHSSSSDWPLGKSK